MNLNVAIPQFFDIFGCDSPGNQGSASAVWTRFSLFLGQIFSIFQSDELRRHYLHNFDKSSKMAKIWQKMKKNLIQKFTDESSVTDL